MQQTLDQAASKPHRAAPQTTAEMRKSVAERVRRWRPGAAVVIAFEHRVTRANEPAFRERLKELACVIQGSPGIVHFSYAPIGAEGGAQTVRYETYEAWGSPDAFLAYWGAPEAERFQRTMERLQSGPSRYSLSETTVQPLATAQTQSWTADGLPRPEHDDSGDDGYWEAGRGPAAAIRFVDNQDGTVLDTLTGLTWLKNANLFGELPWPAAVEAANHLASGAPGLNDGSKPGEWRLPNVNEMQSLLYLNSTFGAAIARDAPFTHLEATNYWTSSSVALAPALGWFVALSVGPPVFDLKMNSMRVWPVKGQSPYVLRTGQKQCSGVWGNELPCEQGRGQDGDIRAGVPWPAERFVDNDDGTVTDNLTGLVWLQNADAFGRLSWQDAIDKCDALAAGEYDLDDESHAREWRLPNVHELRSLVDYSQFAPALPKGHPFNNVRSSLYWSSTTVASAPAFARFVFIGVGPSVWDHKSVLMNVWPVRDAGRQRR